MSKLEFKNGDQVSFGAALYDAVCPVCGEKLEWEASFDADGTSYHAKCCKRWYYMHPATVTVGWDEITWEDDE